MPRSLALRSSWATPFAVPDQPSVAPRWERHFLRNNQMSSENVFQYTCRFLTGLGADAMDGKNTDVLGREAPHMCMTEGSNARVWAFRNLHEHGLDGKGIFFLAMDRGPEASNAAHGEFRVHDFTPALAEFQFLFQLLLLENKPVSDLPPAEGDPTSTVTNIKNRRCMFEVDAPL